MFTVFTVFYAHYAEDHLPKSNGRETIHLSDLSLPVFTMLYAHDAKRLPAQVQRQDRRRLAQTRPKFDCPLEQAFVSNKNDNKLSKPPFLHLSDLMFHGFMVFYAQYAKDHLPSQTGQRKSNQVDQHGRKTRNITAAKPST